MLFRSLITRTDFTMMDIDQMLAQFFKYGGGQDFLDLFCDTGPVYSGHKFILFSCHF